MTCCEHFPKSTLRSRRAVKAATQRHCSKRASCVRVALELHLRRIPGKRSISVVHGVPEIHVFTCATDAPPRESRVLKTGSPFTGLVGSNPTLSARRSACCSECTAHAAS